MTPALAAALALVLGAAPTPKPVTTAEDHLDKAVRCARRDDLACAIAESQLAADAPEAAVAREARAVLATALARSDRDADARGAFDRLLEVYPAWRPPPDADPRVVSAFGEARRERLRRALPKALDPGPPPAPPRPARADLVKLLPQPRLYSPPKRTAAPRFSLSLGAGVGLPAAQRVGAGLHAAVDFRWLASEHLALWAEGCLALLPLDDSLNVEPGHGRGLTTFAVAAGLELRFPLAEALEGSVAVGLGMGGFGFEKPSDATGPALAGSLGVRWQADRNLALRVDASPVVVLPVGSDVGPGGHFAVLLRGETSF